MILGKSKPFTNSLKGYFSQIVNKSFATKAKQKVYPNEKHAPFKGKDMKEIDDLIQKKILHPHYVKIQQDWKKSMAKRQVMKQKNKENFEKFVVS